MSTMTVPTAVVPAPSGSRLRWTLADAATLTWRNLKGLTRIPDAIFFAITSSSFSPLPDTGCAAPMWVPGAMAAIALA